jgi:hypothetical protein
MARNRLSWDAEKVAAIEKRADPYTMNQDHANNPIEKYQTGGPDQWNETPDMTHRWEGEGRTETGHPAPSGENAARGAVMAARKLEDRAIKCITIAQRMLPGAADEIIESQATDLMYLPEKSVLATLQRQSALAEELSGVNSKDEDDEKEDEDEGKSAAASKKDDKAEEDLKKEKKAEELPPVDEKKEKKEKPADKPADPAKEEKPAVAPVPETKEAKKEDKPAEDKKPAEEDEIELQASNADLLDNLFQETEKTGAKKLSGLVKKASLEGPENLSKLWDSPPDISKVFHQ